MKDEREEASEIQAAYQLFSRSFQELIAAVERAEYRAKHGRVSSEACDAIYAELLALEGALNHWPTTAKEHLERWKAGPPN